MTGDGRGADPPGIFRAPVSHERIELSRKVKRSRESERDG
jgi:hypothetical protein